MHLLSNVDASLCLKSKKSNRFYTNKQTGNYTIKFWNPQEGAEAIEDSITRSFIYCTLHQILLG
jgi:hypothetical protein